jgi:hypothetical protein
MGFLLLVVAVVMTVLKLFVMKDKKQVLLAAIGTSLVGGKKNTHTHTQKKKPVLLARNQFS